LRPIARARSLDILRAVAILLVLFHHYGSWTPIAGIGWMGVDLFFVLSGYLVSGLLFDELARTGEVRPGHFLLRRGFKIYPSFWLLILTTVIIQRPVSPAALVSELLFFQNYGPALHPHTWSLAVEEHFYLLVAIAFVFHSKFTRLKSASTRVQAFAAALVAVLLIRIATVVLVPGQYKFVTLGTHVRIDALLCGVAIAWARRDSHLGPRLRKFVSRHRAILLLAAMTAIAPVCALGRTHWFTETIGFSLVYLAFGVVLLVALDHEPHGRLSDALSFVGRASYSIYLWHIPVQTLILVPMIAGGVLDQTFAGNHLVIASCGIALGLGNTRLVEEPMLRLRDRLVPSSSR
jgi:peptidoglycan/LPS O-acetylase OafA/YrhL